MREINLYNISVLDLELFMNVAKYGSFTKAGEKLFMTQSVVSKRISQIENELGLSLFIRNKRQVVLTPAGRVLEERIGNVLDDILDAIQAAHVAQTGASGYLCIGYLEWGDLTFIDGLRKFIKDNPQFSISMYRENFPELREGIAQGRVDMIFTMSYDCAVFHSGDYDILKVQKVPLMAHMYREHPLASKKSLAIEDLRGQPMLMVDQKSSSGYGEYVRGLFRKHNIRPVVAQYAHNGGEHIGNILINKGILLASGQFLQNSLNGQIVRVPIRDEELYVTAVWRKENRNLVLMKYLQMLAEEVDPEML